MTFTRGFLGLNALVFVALGINGLFNPHGHMAPMDFVLTSASSLAEVRANYGGMHVGMGLLFLLGALKPEWSRAALLAMALFIGGLAVGRSFSLLVDGQPKNLILAFIAIEWVGAAIAVWLLRRGPVAA